MSINEAAAHDSQIYSAVQEIREYLTTLLEAEEQQSDIADKLPYERMIEELSMAIYDLELRYVTKTQINF